MIQRTDKDWVSKMAQDHLESITRVEEVGAWRLGYLNGVHVAEYLACEYLIPAPSEEVLRLTSAQQISIIDSLCEQRILDLQRAEKEGKA